MAKKPEEKPEQPNTTSSAMSLQYAGPSQLRVEDGAPRLALFDGDVMDLDMATRNPY